MARLCLVATFRHDLTNSARERIDETKARLRRDCARVREDLAPADRDRAAACIADIGLDFATSAVAGLNISAYCAIGAELDPAPLLQLLATAGAHPCLPVLQPKGQPLLFRAWRPGQPLVTRMWGIREPEAAAPIIEPDLLLVPLLAFDAAGWRLGYGGGYYDRTLERLRGERLRGGRATKPIIAVGVAYDEQEIAEVPRGPHDQRLDWLLTPSGPRRVRQDRE